MGRKFLFRTNIFVCIIIVLGFIATSTISYSSNQSAFKTDVERVSTLTSEGIYHEIDTIFAKPIHISLTMANDYLLKEFLEQEREHLTSDSYAENMKGYLHAYREKYEYDSVFLVSSNTNRYYHYNGLNRILEPDNPENVWYYEFLKSDEEYALNIDNDEALNNDITVFINCKIRDDEGGIMGVVGVGFQVNVLQALLKEYEVNSGVHAYLVDLDGGIQISTDQSSFEAANLFDKAGYARIKDRLLLTGEEAQTFWYGGQGRKGYIVTQYIPALDWHLVIDNDMSELYARLNKQLITSVLIIIFVIVGVLLLITGIIRKYKEQIIRLTVVREQDYRTAFQEETEKMYEDIYEMDITHNCAASDATEQYFAGLGIPYQTPYDKALRMIAKKEVKEEFRQGYIGMFCAANVLAADENGEKSLQYDYVAIGDKGHEHWMRITARIFHWKEDQSVRMFLYRQNIDAEKQQEQQMLEKMQQDSLSGLLNKESTQTRIRRLLEMKKSPHYAFFICDIDEFKRVNDTWGHLVGDRVIADFSRRLKAEFGPEDIVGRIGGDEFVAFLPACSAEEAEEKAKSLALALRYEFVEETVGLPVTASIGVSISPAGGQDFDALYKNADQALYQAKKNGKNGYMIFQSV